MIFSVLIGLLMGYVLAMPPGPVAVTSMNVTFNEPKRSFLYYALGAALIDLCFGLAAAFASSATLSLFDNFTGTNSVVMFLLQMLVIGVFLIVGINTIRKSNGNVQEICNPPKKQRIINNLEKFTKKNPFCLGFLVSGTNVVSPAYISLLIYLVLQVKSLGFMMDSSSNNILFSIAFGLGNFLWLFTLHNIIQHNKHLMSTSLIEKIKKVGGVIYIVFAGVLAYKVSFLTSCLQYLRFLRF